jgi:uncharacterized protein YjbJ (UPF0337 family)
VSEQEPGAAQKAKGLAKEAAGTVMGDEEMKAEGREVRKEGAGEEGSTADHREYFRNLIEETNRRAAGKA